MALRNALLVLALGWMFSSINYGVMGNPSQSQVAVASSTPLHQGLTDPGSP
ncbi:hypothetical protein [Sulfobacillus sp. hq2]|uniref:hypothetical protein n=1 Tax=Sulfobacillus sp. hq2 TaxID=2039167 RepID=UPI001304D017|nr:hypothetical protein [Sulfobacillus sp. hq2]